MGYNAGGTYFENHRSSGFDTVGSDISCVTVLRRSKRQMGIDRTEGMEIDIDAVLMQSTEQCRTRYQDDINIIADNLVANLVLPCPCTKLQVANDPRFVPDTNFRNAEGTSCYIQRLPVDGFSAIDMITYGQQCCFDDTFG